MYHNALRQPVGSLLVLANSGLRVNLAPEISLRLGVNVATTKKNIKIGDIFRTTLQLDREYLRKETRYR